MLVEFGLDEVRRPRCAAFRRHLRLERPEPAGDLGIVDEGEGGLAQGLGRGVRRVDPPGHAELLQDVRVAELGHGLRYGDHRRGRGQRRHAPDAVSPTILRIAPDPPLSENEFCEQQRRFASAGPSCLILIGQRTVHDNDGRGPQPGTCRLARPTAVCFGRLRNVVAEDGADAVILRHE
ncbi:hypothetical protein QFZ56_005937 [Streptomyces achromogenes]|uniref:Uncharacterized protein n=1 Tax=Streptomyces achromogenes TaxID=67255 RepID=A0ABU0Q8I4_STRAH|nr:hypothetical protein [Streptomyces achromogenes]